MYNQVNRGSHYGQGSVPRVPMLPPPPPLQPGYQQAPPHFQQFVPTGVPPPQPTAPHVYLRGPPPPTASSTVPLNVPIQVSLNVMPNTVQSYSTPSQLHHGNSMALHSSNSVVQNHPIPPPAPPLSHSRQEISWAAGPPNRVLPPPPPSQGQVLYNPHICPPPPPSQPGDAQSIQHSHNTLPPPPAPGSGFVAPARPDGTDLHYQVSSITAPPLPSSPPPMPPSPPPLTPPVTSASSHAVRTDDPNSLKASGTELKARDSVVQSSDPNHDDGICVAGRDEVLPPPRSQPKEEKTVQKIEALCQLIAEKGADIEDKIRQDEFQNPEYAFLFGGVPGTEAAISHAYFLWMKKNYNFEPRWREKKSETKLGPFVIDSLGEQNHLHVATVNADSDMEMEDDITPSDKDQGSNQAIEALTQLHERVDDVFSINENIQQLQNSTENDPSKDILSFGSGLSSDLEHIKSARSVTKVHSTVNDSTEVAELPLGTVWDRSSAPLGDDFSRTGTSDLVKANNPDRDSVQLIRSGSPIRLLQDYASDDTSDNEDKGCGADANAFTVSAGANTDVSAAHKDSLCYLDPNIGSKSPYSFQKESVQLSKTYPYDSEISPYLVQESKGIRKRSVSRWASDGHIEHNHENQVSVNIGSSTEAFQGKDGLGGAGIDNGSKSGNAEHEDEGKTSKVESNVLKLDKFGRQLRADLSESDSEDSRYHQNRRVNKRDRSWSRSRSPINRRRRRRSPRRRKEKRSQSRSRSPRHRRSRSRSPIRRHSGDFRGDNVKRDKGQCLDFFRGKCHRGASCRFIHHESDKNATSKNYRNKHNLEIYSHARSSRIIEDMKNTSSEVSNYERDGVRSHGVDHRQKVTGQEVVQRKEDSGRHAVVPSTFGPDVQLVNSNPSKSDDFREVATELLEARVVREETKSLIHEKDSFQKAESSHQQHFVDGSHPAALSSGDAFKLSGGAYKDITGSEDSPFVQQIQSNVSVGIQENSGYPSQHINDSLMSDSSLDKRSIISASAIKASGSEPLPYIMPSTQLQSANTSVGPCVTPEQPSSHSQTSKELPAHNDSSVELPHHTYQLPASVSHSEVENAVHIPQMSRQYGVMQQNTFTPFQSSNTENFEHYPARFHTQNSHFSIPPNSSWTSLPPPPPPLSQAVYNSSLISGVSRSYTEFNQSQLHSRTDFVSHTSMKPGLPARSQSFEFQDQAYPLVQDLSRTFMPTEPFSPKHLPQGIPASQSFSGPNLSREDLHNQFSMQDSKFSSSTPFGGLHPQPKQFSWEPDVNKLPPPLNNKLLPEGHLKSSSDIHPLSQKQPSIHNFQCSAPDVNIGMPGESVTVSRYPPDVLDSNHSTSFNAFGGSRISAHYNPYASTFEKPLSSKFSSSMLRQEHDIIHGNNYGSSRLNHTPIHREDDGKAGSRQSASSPKAAGAVDQILPGSGGDQYDPLFDSIEPSSSSLKKFGFDQKQEVTGESNISLRPKSSYMFMDAEEKNKHEEIGVASTTSQNDEYGETADAEVGVVENESLSNHVDVANMTAGEDEINHIKSPGRRKKSKDSRSMKLFKISIANFVKEVLKPSWRQGNMSKVAFKTIVKKTVDKVSGAMKGHRVPKSQAKISQYIDSSQRKLTKLVMGYVDKYVKV